MRSFETLRVETRDGILELVLDRPEMLNPLDQQAAEELCEVFAHVRASEEVRAVLLRGEGRAFCAGGNVKEMERSLEGNPAAFFEAPLGKIHEAVLALATLPRPVVGALHGFVSGAGFNFALACDFLLCSTETRFNQAFIRLGLVPDTGGTFFLPRLVGSRRAMELFLLGDFIEAGQALDLGIVNRVLPGEKLLDEARDLVRRLAAGPTGAYAEIKQLVLDSANATLPEALEAERQAQLRVAGLGDFKEGVRAFFEKRPPEFLGR